MNKYRGTAKCIKCNKPAIMFAGHLIAKERMALGNLIDVKIHAGWCSEECHDSMISDSNGCYGYYDNDLGLVQNIFKIM